MNDVLSLEQLFAGRVFRVPDYQRGYAWEQQQILEFIEDLDILDMGRDHYAGTVVLKESDDHRQPLDSEGKSYSIFEIVDGQQRLTSVVLLLDAIQKRLRPLNDASITLADGIKKTYISTVENNDMPLHKLTLNADTDYFFKSDIISANPTPEGPQISSEKRLQQAQLELFRYIDSGPSDDLEKYLKWLTDLYIKVARQLKFSLYEVEDAADVGVIFEVMNNRGKPLSELEKVKNYLLYAGSTIGQQNDLAASVNGAWAEMFKQLMAANLTTASDEDQLLRAHWLTAFDPQPKNWNGSKSVKSKFRLRKGQSEKNELLLGLIAYTDGLRASCVSFCDGLSP